MQRCGGSRVGLGWTASHMVFKRAAFKQGIGKHLGTSNKSKATWPPRSALPPVHVESLCYVVGRADIICAQACKSSDVSAMLDDLCSGKEEGRADGGGRGRVGRWADRFLYLGLRVFLLRTLG